MSRVASSTTTSAVTSTASRRWLRNAVAITIILLFAFYALLALDASRSMFHFMTDPQSVAKTEKIRQDADAAAFSRAFKRHTGKSPSDLRAIKG